MASIEGVAITHGLICTKRVHLTWNSAKWPLQRGGLISWVDLYKKSAFNLGLSKVASIEEVALSHGLICTK